VWSCVHDHTDDTPSAGFAIGSAAFVSLALFGAFVTRVKSAHPTFSVDILEPFQVRAHARVCTVHSPHTAHTQFSGLLIGSMLPYAFSALTMKSVGKAALAMVAEVSIVRARRVARVRACVRVVCT
jgi:Na+/H+-translocating membrane pyrophosphatase